MSLGSSGLFGGCVAFGGGVGAPAFYSSATAEVPVHCCKFGVD